MLVTEKQIKDKLAELQVPESAVFAEGQPKRLVWGGYEIVNSLFPELNVETDWYYEKLNLSYEDFAQLCQSLGKDENVQVYCLTDYSEGLRGGLNFGIMCNNELRNTVELAGGLLQYSKIGD